MTKYSPDSLQPRHDIHGTGIFAYMGVLEVGVNGGGIYSSPMDVVSCLGSALIIFKASCRVGDTAQTAAVAHLEVLQGTSELLARVPAARLGWEEPRHQHSLQQSWFRGCPSKNHFPSKKGPVFRLLCISEGGTAKTIKNRLNWSPLGAQVP